MKTKISFLLMALFLLAGITNVYANTANTCDKITKNSNNNTDPDGQPSLLEGEFATDKSRSLLPVLAFYTNETYTLNFRTDLGPIQTYISINGDIVYNSVLDVFGPTKKVIDISNYEPGTYLIELTDEEGGYVYGEFTIE